MDNITSKAKLKVISTGKKSQDPFFVHTGRADADQAFPMFLDDVRFVNVVVGWKDKNGKPGITLVDAGNKKQGTIVCWNESIRDKALGLIQRHLEIMKED